MKKNNVKSWIISTVEALVVVALLYVFCWPIKIDGNSMNSTLQTHDKVIISRFFAKQSNINRGDIIMCKIQCDGKECEVIKRVVALPGEHIKITDGIVFVEGVALEEGYLESGSYTHGDVDLVLADDEFFILGDNREVSLDSRGVGAIKEDKLQGKVLFRFYPVGKMGALT